MCERSLTQPRRRVVSRPESIKVKCRLSPLRYCAVRRCPNEQLIPRHVAWHSTVTCGCIGVKAFLLCAFAFCGLVVDGASVNRTKHRTAVLLQRAGGRELPGRRLCLHARWPFLRHLPAHHRSHIALPRRPGLRKGAGSVGHVGEVRHHRAVHLAVGIGDLPGRSCSARSTASRTPCCGCRSTSSARRR